VIVVSSDAYNQSAADVVVVAMTSNPRSVPYSVPISSADLGEGRLNRPGRVRVDKIYTLAQSIVLRRFGRVHPQCLDRILATLSELTARP
jgi:mRNA interferase MazF